MISNRMRNIHSYLISKYGKEIVEIFWRWEKYEYKIVDFQTIDASLSDAYAKTFSHQCEA